jgi:hypothetical protein
MLKRIIMEEGLSGRLTIKIGKFYFKIFLTNYNSCNIREENNEDELQCVCT